MERKITLKKNLKLKKSITSKKNRSKKNRRKSIKKGSGIKKALSLKKRYIKTGGTKRYPVPDAKLEEKLRISSRERNGRFFIVYLIKLQQFNNKYESQLRRNCNFTCDDTTGFGRIVYPNNPDVYVSQEAMQRFSCLNYNDDKPLTDYKYFEDHTGGKTYFEEIKYNQIFNSKELHIDDKSWLNLINFVDKKFKDNGIKKNIVFGPAELLGPFTRNNLFYGLSHTKWTSNLNFNYIIHMLYLYSQILFVIPKYNNISSEFTNLSSFCNAEGDITKWKEIITIKEAQLKTLTDETERKKLDIELSSLRRQYELTMSDKFARATFNELILLAFLQDEELIDLEFVNYDPNQTQQGGEHKIKLITVYNDKVPTDDADRLGECYYEIHKDFNNTKTKFDCYAPENYQKTFASCAEVHTDRESPFTNGVPYKFHVIIVKTKNLEYFRKKFLKYKTFLDKQPLFPDETINS